jgi:hypothetical protein
MKIKVKIDKDSIIRFLTEHGEKILFGMAVVCFLFFAFYAVMRETLDAAHQPEQLLGLIREARENIVKTPWEPGDVQEVDYAAQAKHNTIDLASVRFPAPLDPPLAPAKLKRSDPTVLVPTKPLVASGFGAFEVKDLNAVGPAAAAGKSGAKLESRTWAVITLIVPVKQQTEEYERAYDPYTVMGGNKDLDVPFYELYRIERLELTPENMSTPADKLVGWEPLSGRAALLDRKRWAGKKAAEVVEKQYVDPLFTTELGPLLGGWDDWEDAVSHLPEIPPASRKAREERKRLEEARGAPANEEGEAADEKGDGDDSDVVRRSDAKPERKAAPAPGPKAAAAGSTPAAPNVVTDKLFRFFDFKVEPGKRYRYRVQIGLKNPNFKLDDRFLKPNTNRKDEILTSGWSEATPVVSIPYGNRILAGKVDSGTMSLLLIAISKEKGLQGSTEFKATRGSKVDPVVKKLEVHNPLTGRSEDLEFDFQTGALVLDLRGGKVLHKDRDKDKTLIEPGEVLVLDRNFNLAVHNELDDADQFKQNAPKETKDSPKKNPAANPGGANILGAPGAQSPGRRGGAKSAKPTTKK